MLVPYLQSSKGLPRSLLPAQQRAWQAQVLVRARASLVLQPAQAAPPLAGCQAAARPAACWPAAPAAQVFLQPAGVAVLAVLASAQVLAVGVWVPWAPAREAPVQPAPACLAQLQEPAWVQVLCVCLPLTRQLPNLSLSRQTPRPIQSRESRLAWSLRRRAQAPSGLAWALTALVASES